MKVTIQWWLTYDGEYVRPATDAEVKKAQSNNRYSPTLKSDGRTYEITRKGALFAHMGFADGDYVEWEEV